MKRLALWLALAASLIAPSAAYGQVCAAVPALPDSERRVAYSPSAATGPFSVTFAILGDGTDYSNWLEVWLNGVKLTGVTDWTFSLTTGAPLSTACRPITNGQVTLTAAATGTLQIVGARRPRRLSQFSENAGVTARDLNRTITDLVAENRETWDELNRALVAAPGDTVNGPLPTTAARAGGLLGFNSLGNPIALATLTGLGNVIGPNVSVVGHIATFGNTSGTLLLDGGLIGAGDVVGPASATDSAIVLFNGTGGKTIKNGPAGTTTTVLHGNAAGAPTYSAVSLTADVSGLLPLANGGCNASLSASNGGILWSTATACAILPGTATANLPLLSGSTATPAWATISYPTSGTSGGILGFTSATVLASSVAMTGNQLIIGQGAGSLPIPLGTPGTTTTVLHGNAAGAPTFAAVSLTADVSGTLPFANGGFGFATGTSGGIPYFNSTTTVASTSLLTANALMLGGGAGAAPATPVSLGSATTVLHGNASGAPSFSAIALTTDVSGTLPVANGGTGLTSGTSGGVLAYTAAGTLASSPMLANNQIVVGGGSGATPSSLGTLGTSTTVLHGNAGGAPTFGAVSLTADVSGTLPLASGGTGQTSAALARTAAGLNIDQVTTFGDTNVSAAVTDRHIVTTAAFTAPRTVTLPTVASYNAGQQTVIVDAAGAIGGANTLIIAANAADSINGVPSITITSQYGGAVLWPVGSNRWGYIASAAGGGSGTVTSVACSGIVACTTFTTSGTVASATMANNTVWGNVSGGVATPVALTQSQIASILLAGTRQLLTSGSGATYTTSANAKYLIVRYKGAGGGGGGGSGTTVGGGNGGNGGATIFNSISCGGGIAGIGGGQAGNVGNGANGGAGGGAGGGSTATTFRMPGNPGVSSVPGIAGFAGIGAGGGGNGAGTGGNLSAGTAGIANSGGGGGGGSSNVAVGAGGGGGEGEYCETRISAPSATYTYTVGAAGTAGAAGTTAGQAGGAGGTGVILVEEYYQ